MRHHIEHLDTTALAWANPSPGVYAKMLNVNEATGERTGLFRFVPDEGAAPPSTCHFHSVYEELFILDGRLSFDSETWLDAGAYVFHPPRVVHGFRSSVPVATTFLARSPAALDFNFPDPPEEPRPFHLDGEVGTRECIYRQPPRPQDWEAMTGTDGMGSAQRIVLSRDSVSGEGSDFVRLAAGSRMPPVVPDDGMTHEGFVLEGAFEADDGRVWNAGSYWCWHPDKPVPALTVIADALMISSESP